MQRLASIADILLRTSGEGIRPAILMRAMGLALWVDRAIAAPGVAGVWSRREGIDDGRSGVRIVSRLTLVIDSESALLEGHEFLEGRQVL
jgi:hypothetical protein